MGDPILFIVLAIIALIGAVGMLLSRNAVHSALYLVLNMFTVAVFYLLLNAPFLAMVQITVYAGAIIVLFLFVIMLLGADELGGAQSGIGTGRWWFAVGLGVVLFVTLLYMVINGDVSSVITTSADVIDSSPTALGMGLFEKYVLPFELAGFLLLAATVGVYTLARSMKKENA